MEPKELSPALLQPQVTVVAILGELLATLPSLDEMNLLVSALRLYWDLDEFTEEFRVTLYCIDDTSGCYNITSDDAGDDCTTSLSQGLATYRNTPWTSPYDLRKADDLIKAASIWQMGLFLLVDMWAKLARKATKIHHTCRVVANKVADMAATATAWAMELQAEAACDGTAQENMVELGQALGGEEGAEVVAGTEAQLRRYAMVAASQARRVRQRVEVALGLLERLVAACDEATAFPRELQRLLRDIEAALKGTNEVSPNVPLCEEGLVAKVAVAERLWEASARLVKDHLLGTLQDIIKFYFTGCPTSPGACGVAKRCQRAMEDIPRLFRHPECHQGVPKVSPVSMEPQEVRRGGEGDRGDTGEDTWAGGGWQWEQEADQGTEGQRGPLRGTGPLQEAINATRSLTPSQLQALVVVVATLGEVVATVPRPRRAKSLDSLHEDLRRFTRSLCAILDHSSVTSLGHRGVPSLGQALATFRATPGTTWANVRALTSAWRELVARLVDSWDWLARVAIKLRKNMVVEQQVVVLDEQEVALEMATLHPQVVAAINEIMAEAGVATRRGHWVDETLELLQRLVATCYRATLFNWNLEWRLRDIEAILKGTNEVSPDVLQTLVVKVAKFEWLWGASTRLAKDHLLGTLGDIHDLLLSPCGDPGGPGSCVVAERCQRAIKDIPRLLLWWCLRVPGEGKRCESDSVFQKAD